MLLCSRYITKSSFPYKLFNNLEIIYCSTSDTQLKSENGDIITKAKTNPDGGVQSVLIPKLGLIKAFPKQIGGALIWNYESSAVYRAYELQWQYQVQSLMFF